MSKFTKYILGMVEQGVQLTSHYTGSGRNESYTSAFFVVKYFNNQKLTMQHTKQLNTINIRPDKHINKYLTEISYSLKIKSNDRAENYMKY